MGSQGWDTAGQVGGWWPEAESNPDHINKASSIQLTKERKRERERRRGRGRLKLIIPSVGEDMEKKEFSYFFLLRA